jgi:hypothetical protein
MSEDAQWSLVAKKIPNGMQLRIPLLDQYRELYSLDLWLVYCNPPRKGWDSAGFMAAGAGNSHGFLSMVSRAQVGSAKIPNAPTPTTEMSSWADWAAAAGNF